MGDNPDFDGDGNVGFSNFLQFAAQLGLSQDDAEYEARFDLDGDGVRGCQSLCFSRGRYCKSPGRKFNEMVFVTQSHYDIDRRPELPRQPRAGPYPLETA